MIPLSEPVLQGRELEYVTDCLRSGWVSSNGEYIARFEQALADYVGVEHAVACNCGTSALHVSLILAGVRADDEVIVPAVTFIAPVNAVRYVGAFPVFVDCDEYCCIDVAGIRRFLAEECTAVDGATVNRPDRTASRGGHPGARVRHRRGHGRHSAIWPREHRPGRHRGRQRGAGLAVQGPDVRRTRADSPASASTATRSSRAAVAAPS